MDECRSRIKNDLMLPKKEIPQTVTDKLKTYHSDSVVFE